MARTWRTTTCTGLHRRGRDAGHIPTSASETVITGRPTPRSHAHPNRPADVVQGLDRSTDINNIRYNESAQTVMKIKILDKQKILGLYDSDTIHIQDIRQEYDITYIEVKYHLRRQIQYQSKRVPGGIYRLHVDISIDRNGSVSLHIKQQGLHLLGILTPADVLDTPLALLIWCRSYIEHHPKYKTAP